MSSAEPIATLQAPQSAEASRNSQPLLSLSVQRVVASLQVVLATRRAARNDEHAFWYTVARGL